MSVSLEKCVLNDKPSVVFLLLWKQLFPTLDFSGHSLSSWLEDLGRFLPRLLQAGEWGREPAGEGRFQYRLQDPGEEGDKRVILSVGSREGAKGSTIALLLV